MENIITSFKVDIFSNSETIYFLNDLMHHFDYRVIDNKDTNETPNDVLLMFSRHFRIPNIIDFINRYKRIIVFERHENIDEILLVETIVPILKEFKGSKLAICHNPRLDLFIKEQTGDDTWYKFPIDAQISIWRDEKYKETILNNNKQYTIKTYLGKRKWDRDLVYLLQKNYCSNDLSVLNYSFNNCGEPEASFYSKVNEYLKTLNIDESTFDLEIIGNKPILDEGFNSPQYQVNSLDYKYYVICETSNEDFTDDEYKQRKKPPRYSLTEKSIMPLANGNIFYDFSFRFPSSTYLKEVGFETFFDDNSLNGLKEFYEMINKYPDDMYNDIIIKDKIKHNYELVKPMVECGVYEMPLYLKHIIDFVNNT
jgi:hypothetical protein